MDIGTLITLLMVAWGVKWFATRYGRPPRHAQQTEAAPTPALPSLPVEQDRRKPRQRLTAAECAELIGEGLVLCRVQMSALGQAFSQGLKRPEQRPSMSSTSMPAPSSDQKMIPVSSSFGLGTPGTGTGTEIINEVGTQDSVNQGAFNKGQLAALQKWSQGKKLERHDIAALLGGKRQLTLAKIDQALVEDSDEA